MTPSTMESQAIAFANEYELTVGRTSTGEYDVVLVRHTDGRRWTCLSDSMIEATARVLNEWRGPMTVAAYIMRNAASFPAARIYSVAARVEELRRDDRARFIAPDDDPTDSGDVAGA